jgi:hypothetical protein
MLERKTAAIAALVATTGAVAAGVAAATPGTGVVSAAILARGTPDNELKLKLMLLRSRPGEVAVQQVTLAPGARPAGTPPGAGGRDRQVRLVHALRRG